MQSLIFDHRIGFTCIIKMKKALLIALWFLASTALWSQTDSCLHTIKKHSIKSAYLETERAHWVSLPMNYDSAKSYPVLYVLDAEWRFDLIRNIAYDMAGNKKIPGHIVVGLPHIEMEYRRGIDLTFSHSRIEYDGEAVDSTWYNAQNSGGAFLYYQYLVKELVPDIEDQYSCNGQNVLIGHSYGGYFAGYLLSLEHPFSALQIYDPSIWYSNGEVIERIEQARLTKPVHVFVSYQPVPTFHSSKIERFIKVLRRQKQLSVVLKKYRTETHNSLFMYSFLEGMEALYSEK